MRAYYKPSNNHYFVIRPDEDAEDPRNYYNLGTIITYNRKYSPDTISENFTDIVRMFYGGDEIDENSHLIRTKGGVKYVVLPVYIYQHGYIAYSTKPFIGRALHAEWDSGLAGLIYADYDEIREHFCVERVTIQVIRKVVEEFEQECEEYTKWCNCEFLRWDEFSFDDAVFEHVGGCGEYYDEEAILNELDLADDFGDFPSIEALELELYRRQAINTNGGN